MERISKILWVITVGVFALTSLLTLSGLFYLWFINKDATLPYLGLFITTLITEIVGVCLLLLKTSVNFLPKTKNYKSKEDVNKFLSDFALSGTSVEFVSNSATWLSTDIELQDNLIKKAIAGNKVTIITNSKPQRIKGLEENGVEFINNISHCYSPNARFTLINSTRQGSEELAIAMGNFPKHKVFIFNGQNSPYIIAMAKDIINLMKIIKEKSNVQ